MDKEEIEDSRQNDPARFEGLTNLDDVSANQVVILIGGVMPLSTNILLIVFELLLSPEPMFGESGFFYLPATLYLFYFSRISKRESINAAVIEGSELYLPERDLRLDLKEIVVYRPDPLKKKATNDFPRRNYLKAKGRIFSFSNCAVSDDFINELSCRVCGKLEFRKTENLDRTRVAGLFVIVCLLYIGPRLLFLGPEEAMAFLLSA